MSEGSSDRKSGKYVVCCRTVEYSSSQNAGGEVGGLDKRRFAMRIDVYGPFTDGDSICPVSYKRPRSMPELLNRGQLLCLRRGLSSNPSQHTV